MLHYSKVRSQMLLKEREKTHARNDIQAIGRLFPFQLNQNMVVTWSPRGKQVDAQSLSLSLSSHG